MSDLRKAAEMALEALEWALYHNKVWKCAAALEALRPALAQPEPVMFNGLTEAETNASASVMGLTRPEPEPVAYTDDVTRIMREAGMTFHLGLPHKAVIEQMTRVVDLVCAEASIKAAQKFAVALAQPEPEPVAYQWLGTSVIRKRIPKTAEADAWQPLYAHPPQRKPLTDDQIDSIVRTNVTITDQNLTGAVYMAMRELEQAHGIE